MRELVQQIATREEQSNIGGVFAVVALVTPSLFAFLASLALRSSWTVPPSLWLCYQILLTIGCGTEAVAIGLTVGAIYSRVGSTRPLEWQL
jgi:hypothetical protein